MLAVVLFAATPTYYFHHLLGHTHKYELNTFADNSEVNTNNNTQNCELEKFETPVQFSVFKFIIDINPFKHSEKISYLHFQQNSYLSQKQFTFLLRGPPTV